MKPIVWSENFSVGVKLFDEQHKRLILMLNKMIKDPTATTRSETVSDILTDMTRYTQEHFRSEEDFMLEYDYPFLKQHMHQHKTFRKKVAKLCVATVDGLDAVPKDLLEYLQQWLTQHILQEDMAYKPFFEEKGVG